MNTGEPGVDEERFLVIGTWTIVTRELLTREELAQRGISYDTLPQIFSAVQVPMFSPPPSPQGPHLHLHHLRDLYLHPLRDLQHYHPHTHQHPHHL